MKPSKDIELLNIAKEIREVIDIKQKEMSLSFIEDTHTYYIKDDNGVIVNNLPSVSTVITQYYTPFDDLTKSLEMCNNDIFEQNSLLLEWRETATYANNKGSRVHYLLESDLLDLYGSYKSVRKPIFKCDEEQIADGNKMIDAGHDFIRLMHRRGAVLLDTEMVLGSYRLGYTGQPDKVWLIRGKDNEVGIVITDWKGLPLNTPILTNNGWKVMNTLTKDDKVFDKDGNLVKIKNISKVKNIRCIKLIFDTNEEIISDYEHRWLITINNGMSSKKIVMTTLEIKNYKSVNGSYLTIENPEPLKYATKNLPIDSYILGLSLNNNNTTYDDKIIDTIRNKGYTLEYISELVNKFDSNQLKMYLRSSYHQRIDLLRGLMDNNGTYNHNSGNFALELNSETNTNDYIELIASLGVKVFKSETNKIIFTTRLFNPFMVKEYNIKKTTNNTTYRKIVEVKDVESEPTKCIEVDSPSNTFLFGKTLIVTHNTNKPKNFVVQHYTGKLLPPFENENDTALEHYKLQLPLYGRLLLEMLKNTKFEGIKLFGCIIVHLLSDGAYKEYRVENRFIDKIMSEPPLPRIDNVINYKKNQLIREEERKNKLKEFE